MEVVRWHRGRSPAYGEGITFWALGEMIRRRAGLAEGDDEPTTRAAVAAMLAEHVPDADDRHWIEPRILVLLGLEETPSGGRDELFAAWRTFFERLAAAGTVVLVFEDIQWADDGLLDFIEHLLDWGRSHPIFVVTLARPELLDRRPGWGTDRRGAVAMRLDPLSEPAMRELLEGLVPGMPGPVLERILARADGIPLYAVETIRMLVADGRLEAADGAWRPTGDLGDLEVPATLHALVAARLDGLGPEERQLIQVAAVLGQSFTLAALAAVTGDDEPAPDGPAGEPAAPGAAGHRDGSRARRPAASMPSCRRSCARSPTGRCRNASAGPGTWRPRGTSSRWMTTSWPVPWRPTTWPRTAPPPTGRRARPPPPRRASPCAPPRTAPRPWVRWARPRTGSARRSR